MVKRQKMINKIKYIIFCLTIFLVSIVQAQDKSGIITYQGVINKTFVDSLITEIKLQKNDVYTKQEVVAIYNTATPEEFVLNFKNEESYYYQKSYLDSNNNANSIGSNAGRNPYYSNNKNQNIIEMSPSRNITHDVLDWKISNKTKTIEDYKCYQAVATEKIHIKQGHYYTRNVIAWFAPEIPLNFGPKHYKGLPGLILEINSHKYTLKAIKINLNPEENNIKINRPTKNDLTLDKFTSLIKKMVEDREKADKY